MSLKNGEKLGQSPGVDPIPKGNQRQRTSGLFSLLKWFRPTSSRESVAQELSSSSTSSLASADSLSSSGTIASFSFVPPGEYHSPQKEKSIAEGPETDTYRARLKQRDRRRESDRNLTLRKKYNLFFHREEVTAVEKKTFEEDTSKSLPLMTKKMEEDEKSHRRTNSESSKVKRAGAYCHVKGKRKAPQPPINRKSSDESTLSLRRKKRLAPQPPDVKTTPDKYDTIEYADAEVLFNDFLKLDHGILKAAKEPDVSTDSPTVSNQSSIRSVEDAPVSPRPWYKRNLSRESRKEPAKFEYIQKIPDLQFLKSDEPKVKKEDKRKSTISFLTNISELDREASEIIRKEHQGDSGPPAFMRPKEESKMNGDNWIAPKRKSARDLIAKFNAITNVTKVTVNSAFFGSKESADTKRDYFGRGDFLKGKHLQKQTKSMEEPERISDRNRIPLMKSESAAVIKFPTKSEKKSTPKFERKTWLCPKCSHDNEYWRIICCLCSTIKPYFDDFAPSKDTQLEKNKTETETKRFPLVSKNTPTDSNLQLERSKTQIGFSVLTKESKPSTSSQVDSKEQERERLKKMLIEMKNSLPKKRLNVLEKQKTRANIIQEQHEYQDVQNPQEVKGKEPEAILITTETIYENIKMKKTDKPKPLKISSAAQTSGVLRTPIFIPGLLGNKSNKGNFELMRPKDFDHIYSVKADKSEDHLYANLLQNKDLFLNMPVEFNQVKNNTNHADTLEINRLLKRLETSIARGELSEAGNLARELAQMKINCSVIRQRSAQISKENSKRKTGFMIDMFVEDKVSHRGPFAILVTANQTVAELKKQVEDEYQIPINVQRWILGKELASDDNATLANLNITPGYPVYLYLVAPTHDSQVVAKNEKIKNVEDSVKDPIPGCSKTQIPPEIEKIKIEPISEAKSIKNFKVEKDKEEIKEIPTTSKVEKTEEIAPLVFKEEDFEAKTLKPLDTKNWECHMCTLLNPINLNFCSVCTTKRQTAIPDVQMQERKNTQRKTKGKAPTAPKDQHYLQLLNLDNSDIVENLEPFECVVCFNEIPSKKGVTLRECLHQFCRTCLALTVEYSEDAQVKCPYRAEEYSCEIALQDREIKALVSPQLYDQYLARSVTQAESKMDKTFHCKTPDCKGWCIYEDNLNEFRCPVCRKVNCLTCQVIHMGVNCKEYQERMREESSTDENAKRTQDMLEEMVQHGEAIKCPTCQVVLMKKWGCDWLRCSMCKTEICWVTRGPRWGPAGKGDTSAGCKCGVNGVKCHPKCNYCH